jgi:hypothetical protein
MAAVTAPPERAEYSVADALLGLQDVAGGPLPDVRLLALALDDELRTPTQRPLLAALLYEMADTIRRGR